MMDRLTAVENLLRFGIDLDAERSETMTESAEAVAGEALLVLGVTDDELKEARQRVWSPPHS